jgi:hypothetical protein
MTELQSKNARAKQHMRGAIELLWELYNWKLTTVQA